MAGGTTEDAEFVSTPAKGVGDVGDASGIHFRYDDGRVVLHLLGVDKLGDFAVVIKARFKTLPSQQWLVGREMNARIIKRFGEARIEMPFPTQTIQFAPESWTGLRQELKQAVRDVLREETPH